MTRLETYDLSLKYQDKFVIQHLGISFEKGSVYSIIGPNGCGKSTLLKALARQLKPAGGQVLLDSKPLSDLNGKDVARQLSYMAQSQEPIEITVKELVGYGRTPHQPYWNHVSAKDREITDWALEATALTPYEDRLLHTLSGGERQSVDCHGSGSAARRAASGRADHILGHCPSVGGFGAGSGTESTIKYDRYHGSA